MAALATYLNDHLGGAMLGSSLAAQLAGRRHPTPLGPEMAELAREIEQDRDALIDLMDRLDVARNPVKQGSAWLAEKGSRLKFSRVFSGSAGTFLALETLTLGVTGKVALWDMLLELRAQHPELGAVDLDELRRRAVAQRDRLEEARLTAGRATFGSP